MIYLKSLKKPLVAFASIAFFGQVHAFSTHLGFRAVEPISNRGAVLRLSAAAAAGLGYAYLMDNHECAPEFRSRDDSTRYIQVPAISLMITGVLVARRLPSVILARCRSKINSVQSLKAYKYAEEKRGLRLRLYHVRADAITQNFSLRELEDQSRRGLGIVRNVNDQLRKPLISDMEGARLLLPESLRAQKVLLNLVRVFPQSSCEARIIKGNSFAFARNTSDMRYASDSSINNALLLPHMIFWLVIFLNSIS